MDAAAMQDLSHAIDNMLAAERLPPAYRESIEQIFVPLTDYIVSRHQALGRMCIVGLCGPQGSGKSTGALAIRLLLERQGLRVAVLSLDDLYLTRKERHHLAETVHPLFATRGPPGTHDIALGVRTLDRLQAAGDIALPSFDKATDERRPSTEWPVFTGPADVVVFEGWCIGALPQLPAALAMPINELERTCDAAGTWRRHVNMALAGYVELFSRIDIQVLLQPPAFEVVARWRCEQEAKLRICVRPSDVGQRTMSDEQVTHFVQHYERVTRHIMVEMPARADALIALGAHRELKAFTLRK